VAFKSRRFQRDGTQGGHKSTGACRTTRAGATSPTVGSAEAMTAKTIHLVLQANIDIGLFVHQSRSAPAAKIPSALHPSAEHGVGEHFYARTQVIEVHLDHRRRLIADYLRPTIVARRHSDGKGDGKGTDPVARNGPSPTHWKIMSNVPCSATV